MTRMWRLIALAVLLLGIAGIVRMYHAGFVWKNGLSLETTVVLFVGLLAFLAVMVQVEAERNARTEEAERQKRSIATAILYEIDNFYKMELDLVEENLAGWDSASEFLPTAVGLRANTSVIYKAVSPTLGSLNAKSVSAIVEFYSMVGSYDGLWRDYQYCLDMVWCPGKPQVVVDAFTKRAKEGLETIRSLIPELKRLAKKVNKCLTQDYGLDELIGRSDAQTY